MFQTWYSLFPLIVFAVDYSNQFLHFSSSDWRENIVNRKIVTEYVPLGYKNIVRDGYLFQIFILITNKQ